MTRLQRHVVPLIFALACMAPAAMAESAASLIDEGLLALESSREREALESFAAARKQNPASTTSLCLFGYASLLLENTIDSGEAFRQAYEQDPLASVAALKRAIAVSPRLHIDIKSRHNTFEDFKALVLQLDFFAESAGIAILQAPRDNPRGQAQSELADLVNAIQDCQRAASHRKGYQGMTLGSLGNLYALLERYDRAALAYEAALQYDPKNGKLCLHQGHALYRLQRYDESLTALDRAVSLGFDSSRCQILRGLDCLRLEREDEAVQAFRQAADLDPQSFDARYRLGRLLLDLGGATGDSRQLDQGAEAMAQALTLNANHVGAQKGLAEAYYALGRYEEAVLAYWRIQEMEPESSQSTYNLGVALGKLGRFEEAVAANLVAIQADPTNAEAHFNLAVALGQLGRLDESIVAYRSCLRLAPANGEALFNLGLTQRTLGRYEDCVGSMRQAIAIDPGRADSHYHLAISLEKTGNLDEAVAAYTATLERDPGYTMAYFNLCNVHQRRGDQEAARLAYEGLLKVDPELAEAIFRPEAEAEDESAAGLEEAELNSPPLLKPAGN